MYDQRCALAFIKKNICLKKEGSFPGEALHYRNDASLTRLIPYSRNTHTHEKTLEVHQNNIKTTNTCSIEEHPSEVFHKICVPHYILCWLANYSVRLLAGKKIADLGLLVFKSIFSE